MSDIITEYVKRHRCCVIAIMGLPISESNHHIFGEALWQEVRKRILDIPVNYRRLITDDDVRGFSSREDVEGTVTIVSSDFVLDTVIQPHFTIFIDTPESVLAQRAVKEVFSKIEGWEHIKRQTRVSRFINDYGPITLTKPEDALAKGGKPWKTFFEIWRTLMRLVTEALHHEDMRRSRP